MRLRWNYNQTGSDFGHRAQRHKQSNAKGMFTRALHKGLALTVDLLSPHVYMRKISTVARAGLLPKTTLEQLPSTHLWHLFYYKVQNHILPRAKTSKSRVDTDTAAFWLSPTRRASPLSCFHIWKISSPSRRDLG